MAVELERMEQAERFSVRAEWFYTSPLPHWEMPAELRDLLAWQDLVIYKGDGVFGCA